MSNPNRSLLTLVAPLLAAAAIVGYLAGHRHSAGRPTEKTQTVSTGSLSISYPSRWRQPTVAGPRIPGLSLEHPLLLAPDGNGGEAGLITGQLVGRNLYPLPATFVALLRGLPVTAAVNLPETQAYRYSRLRVSGFDAALTLYAIPNRGGGPTAVACYASAKFEAYLRVCEQIVATVRLAGQTQIYEDVLTPDPNYAHMVSEALKGVNAERATLRPRLHRGFTPGTAARIATHLAGALGVASEALVSLQAPPPAAEAQTRLLAALAQARGAYTELAGAAETAGTRYGVAQARVAEAEASITRALGDFALLGYRQT